MMMALDLFFLVFIVAPLVAMYRFPRVLAPFALAPLGKERTIPLSPGAAVALGREITQDAGYRAAPPHRIAIGDLPGPRIVETSKSKLFFDPERAEILAREPWTFWRKPRPLVRIRMRAESDRIVLRARWFSMEPVFFIAFFPVVIYASGAALSPELLPICAVTGLVMAFVSILFAYFPAKALVDAAEAEVRSRVARLTEAVAPQRVEYPTQGARVAALEGASTDVDADLETEYGKSSLR